MVATIIAYNSMRASNSSGVRNFLSSYPLICPVNQANLSPKMFDFTAWPNLTLLRLLNLIKNRTCVIFLIFYMGN